MMRALEGCHLELACSHPAQAFSPLAQALQYQARALGMRVDAHIALRPAVPSQDMPGERNALSMNPAAEAPLLAFALILPVRKLAPKAGQGSAPAIAQSGATGQGESGSRAATLAESGRRATCQGESDTGVAGESGTGGVRVACEIHAGALLQAASDGSIDCESWAQAVSGLMSVHGRASGRAQPLGLPYVSTVCAALALQAGMAQALARLDGAPARRCQVSMMGAALLCVGQYLAGATTAEAPEQLLPGCNPPDQRPPYVSQDGIRFELETLDAAPWRAFWQALGVEGELAGRGWHGFLLRYAKAIAPQPPQLMHTLASLPYAQIAAVAQECGVAICPLRSLQERAQDADARHLWQQGPWAFTGGVALPAPAGCAALPQVQSMQGNLPQAQLLQADLPQAQLAQGDLPQAQLPQADLPLAGLTLVESCRRIQGPLAGHLLAMLGMQVIRIEPPGGDPLRGMPPMADGVSARFDALNRLKSVQEIDIKSAAGRAAVAALAQGADVFLHNWAPGKAQEMQLDAADLARHNPALVYAYAGGWGVGDPGLPGTDFMAQAWSGVASMIGAASGTPGGSLFTVLDVLGGVIAAQGICAALLARRLHGRALQVETSLLGAASLLCAAELPALFAPQTGGSQARADAQAGSGEVGVNEPLAVQAAAPDADSATCCAPSQSATAPLHHLADLALAAQDPAHPLQSYLQSASYLRVRSPWSFV